MRTKNTFKPLAVNLDTNERVGVLESAIAARDRVLATLIHDVKGPVHSLFVFLEEQKDALTKEDLGFIIDEALKKLKPLDKMLSDVFEWAAHSMKKEATLKNQATNIHRLVTDSIEALACQAAEKQVSVFAHVDQSLTANCDWQSLQIVLRNLITNAIKFSTSTGKIWVQGGVHDNVLELSVIDEGIGMKPAVLEKLFSEADVKTTGTHGEKGTGMGLIFCRQLLESEGGELEIDSEYGKGTRCTVHLPLI